MKHERPFTIIQSDQGWLPLNFKEIWAYRDLLYLLVWRDIQKSLSSNGFRPSLDCTTTFDDDRYF